jgi:pimeloyl-ACP methyl ester carboxylesterase
MPAMSRRLVGLASILLLVAGCESGDTPGKPAPSPASAQPPPPPPPPPPTPKKAVTFSAADGAALSGDLYLAADPRAPSAVLVHRLYSDRHELAPLAERLARADKRYTVLIFDLRGHGASKAPPKAKADDTRSLSKDVAAAIDEVGEVTGGKTRGVVLVGTSLGAALVSEVAFDQAKVTALGLISPGAAVSGHDIYRPYAEVRNLPTFIAGAKNDNVASLPVDSLEKMAMSGTVKRYDGNRHSAEFLGVEHPELWSDLEAWMMSVFERTPSERRSLYFAPGKEPKKPGATASTAKHKGAR